MANQEGGEPAEQQSRAQPFGLRDEEIVQVVYQSDQHGSLVGVESTSLLGGARSDGAYEDTAPDGSNYGTGAGQSSSNLHGAINMDESGPVPLIGGHYEQLTRAASTLPPVAEESTVGTAIAEVNGYDAPVDFSGEPLVGDQSASFNLFAGSSQDNQPSRAYGDAVLAPIYSTINKTQSAANKQQPIYENQAVDAVDPNLHAQTQQSQQQQQNVSDDFLADQENRNLIDYQDEPSQGVRESELQGGLIAEHEALQATDDSIEEISRTLTRQRAGAVEKGSFRNNFRKKLGVSVSTNENDLTAHRRQFLDSSGDSSGQLLAGDAAGAGGNSPTDAESEEHLGSLPSKFKRTHSVSFNVDSGRSNRHSVDIRNLPSYLTHKRASIVDVAKGAMSSLISSLGGGGGGGGGSGANSASGSAISAGGHARDSYQADDEPIFEEPIAPTLSLGQRVAMVRNSGAEFGTVGWIGQLPDVDDDWIVGVIFDNMIGDCDGAYNGVRYFYARSNYAMFVPLSTLTKTDNYIGRPETGTMLSRMSVSLKPGQLISIQRSSIRLQHCFLNAPHQRVGHDVRAVSNRLHCQCHNCGPCAHLTKQGRINALPQFGAHHLPHRKKNSLAHAAVEMLAHHHHHFHEEEEEHEEKDFEFGDNAAHACNFVRYSCCQQSGQPGHEFAHDCSMVRPELLDNLIHAPKAPARRSKLRRPAKKGGKLLARQLQQQQQQQVAILEAKVQPAAITSGDGTLDTTVSIQTNTLTSFDGAEPARERPNFKGEGPTPDFKVERGGGGEDGDSSYLSTSNSASSSSSSRSSSPVQAPQKQPYNYYTYDTSSFRPTTGVYNTIDSQISFMDQQRFVYRRDSGAVMQSPKPSNWSDDYDASYASSVASSDPLGFKRILRCLGCVSRHRASGRRRPQRKLSFRDRVLEYRRRQSTFVPSTLAKPHEDFASHGIILPSSSGGSQRRHHGANRQHRAGPQYRAGEINSDYSSCSRSSCSSSRSSSPPNFRAGQSGAEHVGGVQMQAQLHSYPDQQAASVTLEHGHSAPNDQLKSSNEPLQGLNGRSYNSHTALEEPYRPQLDYGDFSYGDGYSTYAKNKSSRDSALTDLAYSDNTHKSNSSSDTLKHLIDQSINDQVSLPQPMQADLGNELVSPLTSSSANQGPEGASPDGEQYEISSLTASVADNVEAEESVRQGLEDFSMDTSKDSDQH